jgi:ABC-type multidrug transport system ATPase subunit
LSLARALVHDPRVLLLDEPASGLDPGARIALRVLLRRLAAEGRTVLVSSHVLAELDELADRAVFLDAGMSVSAARVEAAQRAARGWRIRSLDAQGLHRALVASGIDADRIQTEPQGLVVPLTGEEHAAQLLAQLVRGGIPIVSFAPAVGDLEHTFLDLSAGGDPGGGPGGDPAERDPSSDAEEAR